MNLIHLPTSLAAGSKWVELSGERIGIPETREGLIHENVVLGARPEHVRFDDDSKLRAKVLATEYLGTTQIVTVAVAEGRVKARVPAAAKLRMGEHVGLRFASDRLSIFDKATGLAIRSVLHEGVAHG